MSYSEIERIVSAPFSTVAEAVSIMQAIDALLPDDDGLKWFNFLYLKVTEKVLENPPAAGWSSPVWLARLDVVFAGLYFDAIGRWINNSTSAPKAWRVLLDARQRHDIMRVQFALCGMNAHINRDLQLAVVQTGQELNVKPDRKTPEHDDFKHVNSILEEVEKEVLPIIATGPIGEIEQRLGRLDNILALWGVAAARETAWSNAEVLWTVRHSTFLRRAKMEATDSITGALGRALIIPVG